MALCPCMSFHHGTTAHMHANVISITNKLNTAPCTGPRRAEHRTLLVTCVKFGREKTGEEMCEEQQRIHENTPGVFYQFLIFWATCSDIFLTLNYSHFCRISSFFICIFNLLISSHFSSSIHFVFPLVL